MREPLLSLEIKFEQDVVLSRQRARQVADLLGFDNQEQVRVATAISELARNAYQYAGHGRVEFAIEKRSERYDMAITVEDRGPGITNLQSILSGEYKSSTGMGLGLLGTKRLMDSFFVDSTPGHTVIKVKKTIPQVKTIDTELLNEVRAALSQRKPRSAYEEVQRQNQELMSALEQLRIKQDELVAAKNQAEAVSERLEHSNRELEETNQGVLALYKELDDKAADLKRANEVKTQFLSNVSHEFRTPLNSILGLSQLVLDRVDGELTSEQERQLRFIHKAAAELSEMVNDLLDLAKVESGKVTVYKKSFELSEVFAASKGMFRPIFSKSIVDLVFEQPTDIPVLLTDEGKVSQILRNFISNAVKFTEQGEVRVTSMSADGFVSISVSDTGIGIAKNDLNRIFEEFTQVASERQTKVVGTGLGLSLSRRLARVLGGDIHVESERGKGSTFTLTIPIEFTGEAVVADVADRPGDIASTTQEPKLLLVVDDDEASRYVVTALLQNSCFEIIEADGAWRGIEIARSHRPDVILLDFSMPEMDAFGVLRELQADPRTKNIPVIINSSRIFDPSERARLEPLTRDILSKQSLSRDVVLRKLQEALVRIDQEGRTSRQGDAHA